MKKKLFYFTTIVTMLLFGACNNEELPETEIDTGRTITLTASMPEDDPDTRVSLTPDSGLGMNLNWEANDVIALLFVQGAYNHWGQVKVPLTSIVGKRAFFDIPVPNGIDPNKKFDVYGVYGGSYDINLGDKTIQLPQYTFNRVTLSEIQNKKDVILTFAYHFEASANLDVSVDFKHVGSLFCVHLKSTSNTSLPIVNTAEFNGVRLIGGGEEAIWAFGNGTGVGETINLLNGEFLQQEIKGKNNIRFQSAGLGLSAGQSVTMWAWNPVTPNKEWPALQLQLIGGGGPTVIKTSTNSRPAKTPLAGKTYHFYVEYDSNGNLNFTDSSGNILP